MTTSTAPNDRYKHHDRFVAAIRQACQQPGLRAALRSGVGKRPEHAPRMHAVVARWLPATRSPERERAYYSVAALIAAQPREARDDTTGHPASEPDATENVETAPPAQASLTAPRPNLGYSLAEAVNRRQMTPDSTEKRLYLLARQGVDGVHRQLPALVRHLRTDLVPLDWSELLHNLLAWPYNRDVVAKRWLQSYYRTLTDHHSDDHDDNTESTKE